MDNNKKTVFLPLEPQPESNMIIALRRYYAKHKHSPAYEERISWIDEGLDEDRTTVACYEYRGLTPREVNNESEKNYRPTYTRNKPTVLETIKDKVKTMKPKQVYDECDVIDGPINKKQLYNAEYCEQKKRPSHICSRQFRRPHHKDREPSEHIPLCPNCVPL